MSKGASLPALCVKCGSSEIAIVNKDFVWLEPMYYLTLLFGPLIFLIVYLIVRKKVKLSVPLCERHRKLVNRMRVATAVLLIGGPAVEALLIAFANPDAAGWGIFLILFILLGGIITLRLQRPLTTVRIDDDRVTLKGACDVFLSRLATKTVALPQ
jgi:preprotein translocase subunit YajC